MINTAFKAPSSTSPGSRLTGEKDRRQRHEPCFSPPQIWLCFVILLFAQSSRALSGLPMAGNYPWRSGGTDHTGWQIRRAVALLGSGEKGVGKVFLRDFDPNRDTSHSALRHFSRRSSHNLRQPREARELDAANDIPSLTTFRRRSGNFMKRLKTTKCPGIRGTS